MNLVHDQKLTFSHQYTYWLPREPHIWNTHQSLDIPSTQVMNTFYSFEKDLHMPNRKTLTQAQQS